MSWAERPDIAAGEYPRADEIEAILDAIERLHQKTLGMSYYTGGSGANSTGSEAALAAWTATPSGGYTARAGYVYRADVQCVVYNAQAAFATIERCLVLVRQTTNSTSSTSFGGGIFTTQGTSSSGAVTKRFSVWFKNTGSADVTGLSPGVTITRNTGSAANHLYGDASLPLRLTVTEEGLATDPELVTMAASAVALT